MTSVSGSGERILAILDLFTEARPEWTPEEMMERLGYTRTTLYRYLKTLKDAGYIVSLPGSGFTLGPRVTELDFLMRSSDPLIRAGQPAIGELVARYPCSAFLVRWYGQKILCVASEVSAAAPKSSYPRGRPMSLARGAISRAIIASLPRREQVSLIGDNLPDFRATGMGRTVDEILNHLREIRRQGVATARGEVTPGVIGVAAPILEAERSPIAALCVTSNETDLSDPARLAALQEDVRRLAARISEDLGRGAAENPNLKSA